MVFSTTCDKIYTINSNMKYMCLWDTGATACGENIATDKQA